MEYNNTGIFIQARSNSSRLKNKIYAGIPETESVSQLAHIYYRMKNTGINTVSILVPESDKKLQDWCKNLNFEYFCGSENDVRDRYQRAADYYEVDWVARATGDNPCVDTQIALETIKIAMQEELDLFSFNNLPLGMAIEVIKTSALNKIANSETTDYKEHVSLHIKHNPDIFKFRHDSHKVMENYKNAIKPRMTVDTIEDLQVVRQVFMHLGFEFGVSEVMHLTLLEPAIFKINANINQKTFSML